MVSNDLTLYKGCRRPHTTNESTEAGAAWYSKDEAGSQEQL
jgi:hypothetical protein